MSGGFQPRQSRRVLVGVAVLVALAVVGTTAAAGSENGGRPVGFERLPAGFNYAGFVPAMAREAGNAKLIIKLKGAPVAKAEAQAQQQGKHLTKAEKEAIRQQLRSEQGGIEAAVRDLGGKVEFAYQDAYNGLAVTVPLSAVGQLASRSDVESVQPQRIVERENVAGVQFIRGNEAWTDTGNTGDGVKIAVIDTGLDYTHANFGGSGDPADFENNDGTVIEPGSFPTDKVIAGFDFVGDDYDATSDDPAINTPHPDPDPLDCNGHGSHTAGTAGGFGVLADGSTFTGPYDGTTYTDNSFKIGPGVAPEASLMAYRAFGCEGSATDAVVVAAINRAVEDGADVINMSLGSVFGRADAVDSEASDNAAEAGVVVVASAGNDGPNAYLTGSPAAADRAISVAAIDASSPTYPGVDLGLSTGTTVTTINANGAAVPAGPLDVVVLRTSYPDGPVSLGCDPDEYNTVPGGVSGKLVVTKRGTCARVARAIFGEQAGAAAVVMINTSNAYPPFEGPITSNPDTGEPFTVTIPFLGAKSSSEAALVAADGGTTSLTETTIENTSYKLAATFTSGGPRNVDSAVKPEVMAPGVSVLSTLVGSGTEGTFISGTSMAAPMTAGAAALVRQANPAWTPEQVKAALINTAEAGTSKIASGYLVRTQGSGVIDARRAVDTVALATTTGGKGTLDYGAEALSAAYSETLPFTITNTSGSGITYDIANVANGGQLGASVTFSANQVTVAAGGNATVDVTLSLNAAAVAALPAATASNFGALATIRGVVTATPTAGGAGIYTLRVPYLVAPRGLSNVTAGAKTAYASGGGSIRTTTVPLSNSGIRGGTADVYAWGISDPADTAGAEGSVDVLAAGVQALPGEEAGAPATDRFLVFAVNFNGKSSNPAISEIDIPIDLQHDGRADYWVVGVDFGAVTAGSFDGRFTSFTFDADFNLIDAWVATAPMNGSTVELPALASEIGLDPAVNSTRFSYAVGAFSFVPGDLADVTESSSFRSHQPPVSTGDFLSLAPGGSSTLNLWVDKGKNAGTRQLGWLVVTTDDQNGGAQAEQVPIGTP